VKPPFEVRPGAQRRAMRGTALLAAAAAALAAAPAAGQDVEMLSRMSGRPLPQGYWDRIRETPDFFEPRRTWRGGIREVPGSPTAHDIPLRGSLRMVVVLGLFADSPEPPVSSESLQRRLFGDNPDGSLTQYYQEISQGLMHLTGTVTPWVRSGYTRAQAVGESHGLGRDALLGFYLKDVLDRADETTDFSQFDNDGPDNLPNSGDDDGVVDMAVFQFAEVAAPCGGPGVWPHHGEVGLWMGVPHFTDDPGANGRRIVVEDYHIQSAVECDGTPQGIAPLAHEVGHRFALPDWYDPLGSEDPAEHRWIQGCWTLMAAGAWGCGDGATFGKVARPPHPGPFDKIALDWATATVSQPGWRQVYTLRPVQQSGDILHVPLEGFAEYLLLEYRPNTGFDAGLPAGGVLVYHIDLYRPRWTGCRTCPPLYVTPILEADGDGALLRSAREGGNRGAAGDVFAGTRLLDEFSTPRLRLNSGQRTGVGLEIIVSGGVAHVVVSTVPVVQTEALLAPLLGTAGQALTADELSALDYFGNRDGRYDMGDLRSYMRYRPETVRQGA
jgi:M6 family metalloprotease-like protein